jgi:hypothetical protein
MPTLDVSEAFDPSFMDCFTVVRRTEIIGQYGRPTTSEKRFEAIGVVVPSSPNDLERLPEIQYMNKAITIYTQCRLQGPSAGYQPDEVVWHGSQFMVRALDDYSGYGRGFIMVVCISIDAVDPAPPFASVTTVGSA